MAAREERVTLRQTALTWDSGVTTTGRWKPTAVHLVAGVVAVHLLIALAGVGDATSVSALELIGGAQRGWKRARGQGAL